MAPSMPFVKMNGLGNEIIVADRRSDNRAVTAAAAIALADPDAVPFDQLMEIGPPKQAGMDYSIRILNSDGSTAGACGNGTRCVVDFLKKEVDKADWNFEIMGQPVRAKANLDGSITVDMGVPRFEWHEIPLEEEFGDTTGIELQIGPIDAPVLHTPSVANIGNPHAVFWVDEDPYSYDLHVFGPMLENHPIFPDRANITIAQVQSDTHVVARTWERGAGLTQACGSAACATLVCGVRKELLARKATVTLPGGDLIVEWDRNDRVQMTGPVAYEFGGALDPETGAYEIDPKSKVDG